MTSTLEGKPFRGTILLSHLHWDHVQGLPFFAATDRYDAARTATVRASVGAVGRVTCDSCIEQECGSGRRLKSEGLMRRMLGLDTALFAAETPTMHAHLIGVMVLDPSTAAEPWGHDTVVRLLRDRIHQLPPFPWSPAPRCSTTPGRLSDGFIEGLRDPSERTEGASR